MTYKPANPNGQATMANSEPVVIASDQSVLSVKGTQTQPPTSSDEYVAIRVLPQSKIFYGFDDEISNDVQPGLTLLQTGAGMTVNQTAGDLVITSGTTASSETVIRSDIPWSENMTLRYGNRMSQRINNNNTFVELVDIIGEGLAYTINSATSITVTIPSNPFTAQNVGQGMTIGLFNGTGTYFSSVFPIASVSGNDVTFTVSGFAVGSGTCSLWGWNRIMVWYSGTIPTSAACYTSRNGRLSGTAATTLNTGSSSAGSVLNIEDGVALFASQETSPNLETLQTVLGAQFVDNVPDPSADLYLQIRVTNNAAAPASSTTNTFRYASVETYTPQQVSLTSVRPQTYNAAAPVAVESVRPGTSAGSLGKAEDSPHTTGDTGVFVLGVASSSATVYGTSGDYTPLSVDTAGRLRVHGASAQDAAVGGDVVLVGGRASAAIPSGMSADGDAVFLYLDRAGRQVVTNKAGTSTLTNVSGSASSVTVLAANTSRLGATIYNDSTAILYLKFGATASTTSFTVKLQADDYYEVPFGYNGIIDGIWASATGSARVTELS